MVILFAGLPGVGKSTLARTLATHIPAYILDKDTLRDAIFPTEELDYSSPQNALATQVMFDVAEYILARDAEKTIILDGKPFSKREQIQAVVDLAERVHTPLKIIHCVAPDEVVKARLEHDQRQDPSNITADRSFAKYLRIKRQFDPITEPHLTIDTSAPLEATLSQCLDYLKGREKL